MRDISIGEVSYRIMRKMDARQAKYPIMTGMFCIATIFLLFLALAIKKKTNLKTDQYGLILFVDSGLPPRLQEI